MIWFSVLVHFHINFRASVMRSKTFTFSTDELRFCTFIQNVSDIFIHLEKQEFTCLRKYCRLLPLYLLSGIAEVGSRG